MFSVSQLRDYVLFDRVRIVCNYPRIGSIYFVGIQVIIVASMIFLFQMYGCQFGREWLRAYCGNTENEPERERDREKAKHSHSHSFDLLSCFYLLSLFLVEATIIEAIPHYFALFMILV